MHVTTKDTSNDGALHTLTSVLEADGPNELASAHAILSGRVVGFKRTASGGIEVVTEVRVQELSAEPSAAPVEPEVKPELPEPTTIWGKARGKKQ